MSIYNMHKTTLYFEDIERYLLRTWIAKLWVCSDESIKIYVINIMAMTVTAMTNSIKFANSGQ